MLQSSQGLQLLPLPWTQNTLKEMFVDATSYRPEKRKTVAYFSEYKSKNVHNMDLP